MVRPIASLLSVLFAVTLPAGCYAPERMASPSPIAENQAPADGDSTDTDECTGDCEICASYCAVMLVCSAEPPTAQDCAWDCLTALEGASPECGEARRDGMSCVGDLSCGEFTNPDACADEFDTFEIECDGEYDDEPHTSNKLASG